MSMDTDEFYMREQLQVRTGALATGDYNRFRVQIFAGCARYLRGAQARGDDVQDAALLQDRQL